MEVGSRKLEVGKKMVSCEIEGGSRRSKWWLVVSGLEVGGWKIEIGGL